MSGGGVFSIDGNLGDYKVNFRGLILGGGNDNIYMIEASFIREMIEKTHAPYSHSIVPGGFDVMS